MPINQGKPIHEFSYGVRIPGARSDTDEQCVPKNSALSTINMAMLTRALKSVKKNG